MTVQKGLVLINTGTGKGKTTAALGTAIRAWGDGQKVLILQFIKGAWKYGELKAVETWVREMTASRFGRWGTASSSIIRIKKVKKNSGGKRHWLRKPGRWSKKKS